MGGMERSGDGYLAMTYDDAKKIIRINIKGMARNFIAVGFYLKHIRDNRMYEEDGYVSIWDFAEEQYGISRSTASRWMSMNDRFSENGNSPNLAEEYKEFGKSQLQEMLYLPEDRLEEVTANMTVKEIRQIREPEKQDPEEEKLSYFGLKKTVRPGGSLLTTVGCGNGKHDCFSCCRECEIRQEDRQCRVSSCGNPKPCGQIGNKNLAYSMYSDHCMFLHPELAPIRKGDKEPEPCCLDCNVRECSVIRCSVSKGRLDEERKRQEAERRKKKTECEKQKNPKVAQKHEKQVRATSHIMVPEKHPKPDTKVAGVAEMQQESEERCRNAAVKIDVRDLLKEKSNELDEWLKEFEEEGGYPEFVEKQKIIVAALAAMVCDLENQKIAPQEQPELPKMRNNDQRKAFLNNYQTWPVWFEVPQASEVYHRYNLPDGTSIVICEYHMWLEWKEKYSDQDPHSIGTREYLLKPGYHYLHDCLTNRTALVEKLKEVQKV